MAELLVMHHATCARKALIVMLEKDAPVVRREMLRDELRGPGYRKLNPDGVVPTFVADDGRVLVESSVIMRYLDEAYAGPSLQPADPWARAEMNLWMKLVDEKFFPALVAITVATYIRAMFGDPLDEARLKVMLDAMVDPVGRFIREDYVRRGTDSPYVAAGLGRLREMLERIEQTLGDRDWLAGDGFSLADCAMMPIMLRFEEFGLAKAWSDRLPRTADWWQRLSSRPSVTRLIGLADKGLLDEVINSIGAARAPYLAALGGAASG